MENRITALIDELEALNTHINKVAEISEQNDLNLSKSIDDLMKRTKSAILSPALAIAAIIIALDKKGTLDRKDVIAVMDGLVASLTPPDTREDAALLIELIIQILRSEANGTLQGNWKMSDGN